MSLRDNLLSDAVRELRVLTPVTVDTACTVAGGIEAMQTQGGGCVVITDGGKPSGVFTERDVLTKVLAGSITPDTPIVDVMTSPARVIRDGCSVAEVIKTMHEGGFRHMPVVDDDGRLTGIVSVRQIVEYLVEHFPSAVFNLPPDPECRQLVREGA